MKITAKQATVAAIIAAEFALLVGIAVWAHGVPADGVVVAPGAASLAVSPQVDVVDTLVIDQVKTPVDAWVVVSREREGMPGEVLGSALVRAGESTKVDVKVAAGSLPATAAVALVADMGTPGKLEYNPADMAGSADKMIVSGGKQVVATMDIKAFSRDVSAGEASVGSATIDAHSSSVTASDVVAPGPSWLVVATPGATPDVPGAVIGYVSVGAGRHDAVVVPVSSTASASVSATAAASGGLVVYPASWKNLEVYLFADQGAAGTFEFDPASPATGADQPYRAGGVVVMASVDTSSMPVATTRAKKK